MEIGQAVALYCVYPTNCGCGRSGRSWKFTVRQASLASKAHRILVVDDHTIMRDGLQALLSAEPDYEVVGTTSDGEAAIQSVESLQPDIVLMGLSMVQAGGVEAIAHIKQQFPEIKIIALTFHKEGQYIRATFEAGADGYLLKDDSRAELFMALGSVLHGKNYLSPAICSNVIAGYLARSDSAISCPTWAKLTHREKEVITLIAEGHTTRQIATRLSLSPGTVGKHRTNLMKKLGLHSVSAVTAYAIQNRLVT